ncbi:hypothetical protein GGR58DRAFT_503031 [Xylaria digitata]|nr:hypothetical protein GGR58DRAFT_503031 [Xylaria digitata]
MASPTISLPAPINRPEKVPIPIGVRIGNWMVQPTLFRNSRCIYSSPSGSTPNSPDVVCLKTAPLSHHMMVHISQRNVTRTPTFSPGASSINIRPGADLLFQELSDIVWRRMLSNPSSTVHWLLEVPSSQLINIVRRTIDIVPAAFQDQQCYGIDAFNLPRDSPHAHDMHPISQLHPRLDNDSLRANLVTQSQLHFINALSNLCIILANGSHLDIRLANNDTNEQVLRVFFGQDLPAVAATWSELIHLSTRFKSGDSFRTLVEVGFETHNGEWIQQHAEAPVKATAILGSERVARIAERLLSSKLTRHALRSDLDDELWNIIENLDAKMMSIFSNAGVKLQSDYSRSCILFQDCKRIFSRSLRRCQTLKQRQRWAGLVNAAGFDIDSLIPIHSISASVFLGFDRSYTPSFYFPPPLMDYFCFDGLWLSGQHEIYEVMVGYSKKVKTHVTISGLTMAAQSGAEHIRHYLDSRQIEGYGSRRIFLETALSVATGLGNVAAIKSYCEFGVDPNTDRLLSHTKNLQQDWHPLMRAAAGKHMDAIRVLVEMGAEIRSNISCFDPLSAAVWKPLSKPLSDAKRAEQREIVKFPCRCRRLGWHGRIRAKEKGMNRKPAPPSAKFDGSAQGEVRPLYEAPLRQLSNMQNGQLRPSRRGVVRSAVAKDAKPQGFQSLSNTERALALATDENRPICVRSER